MRRLLLLALLGWGLCGVALAAVTPNSPVSPQNPHVYRQRFVTADAAGTYKTLVTGGVNGTRCHALWIISDDTTAAHQMTFRFTRGGLTYPGPVVGTTTTQVPVSVLNSTTWPGLANESDGNSQLLLDSGDLLEVTYATAITATKILGVHAECWDF
jgi:hypothetical protein